MTKHISRTAMLAGAALLAMPGAVKSVRAEADSAAEVKNLIDSLTKEVKAKFEAQNKAWEEFKTANNSAKDGLDGEKVKKIDADVAKMTAEIDKLNSHIATLKVTAGGGDELGGRAALGKTAEAKAHAKAFNSWFRRGAGEDGLEDLAIKAAVSEGSNPDGGYTVPVQVETTIDRVLAQVSAMRRIARVMTIGGPVYRKPVSQGGMASGWVGEKEQRPETGTPKLSALDFEAMELYAMPAATQALLDDSNIDIAQWLADEVQIVFAEQESAAFIAGDGHKKPKGLLSYNTVADANYAWGKLGFVPVGAGGAFAADADALIDLVYALKQGYRLNASWLMNRKTQAAVRKLKDENGVYLWQPGLTSGQPASLLGYPVNDDDNMPDVAANSTPVAFGDFQRGYLIVDRAGIRTLRDPYSNKPYVLFYTTKRVGGGVQNFEAIKLGKITA